MQLEPIGPPAQSALRRGLVASAVVVLLAILFLAGRQPETASAHNDYCTTYSGGWYCYWNDPNLAPATPHWFSAAVTLRNWNYAAVNDGHGGTVTQKCVHMMRGSDGYTIQIACGGGTAENFTPGYMRPGYLFTRHGAGGARSIQGDGAHG
jgi:hypothetical protein